MLAFKERSIVLSRPLHVHNEQTSVIVAKQGKIKTVYVKLSKAFKIYI